MMWTASNPPDRKEISVNEPNKPTQGPPQQNAYGAAYLDAKRFPLTTQGDLDLDEQRLLDAVNMDDLREMRENG
jgi:hypothetical protein